MKTCPWASLLSTADLKSESLRPQGGVGADCINDKFGFDHAVHMNAMRFNAVLSFIIVTSIKDFSVILIHRRFNFHDFRD